MAEKVKVWFDPEADYLEVQFREAPGFMRATHMMRSWSGSMKRGMCWASVSFVKIIR